MSGKTEINGKFVGVIVDFLVIHDANMRELRTSY